MNRHVGYYDGTLTEEKFDKEMLASETQDGLMSKEDKIKLDQLTGGGSQVESIEADKVIQDTEHRFTTDAEKTTWNGKADSTPASATANGLMSLEDKVKLDGVEEGANNYVHPETHEATMIVEDTDHKFVSEAQVATWDAKPADKEALGLGNVTNDEQVKRSGMGVANGVATLDENGMVPAAQLPGFVDDIVEFDSLDVFPATGESGKLYFDKSAGKTYRWSGTEYVSTDSGLALGETAATAYAGDKGKANADVIAAIKDGTVVVAKATDAATVGGHSVAVDVPADAVFTDTVYTHPETHPATMITEDTTHRFSTDVEKASWSAKAPNIPVTGTMDGLMLAADKVKLDGVEEGANAYVHPESHPATMVVEDTDHKFVTEAQVSAWDAKADTTYEVVTAEADGLMAKEDKVKLDSIPEDAVFTDTVYTHPESHEATMIVEDDEHKFATAAQLAKLDAIPHDTHDEPYAVGNTLYACGFKVVLEAAETVGMNKATWTAKEGLKSVEFTEGGYVYGGGDTMDSHIDYPATNITINSGKYTAIYGANKGHGSVGHVNITVNGGTFREGINGGAAGFVGKDVDCTVGTVDMVINNNEGQISTVFGGSMGAAGVAGTVKITVNGGNIGWLTAGGSNGHTSIGEVVVNGGTVRVLQGCNRGTMHNIKLTVNGGAISSLYAGGETEDKGVTATYDRAEVVITGGAITKATAGTDGGVENAAKVSGTFVEGIIDEAQGSAMNLSKVTTLEKVAAGLITSAELEGKTLVLKNGETVIASVDLTAITA